MGHVAIVHPSPSVPASLEHVEVARLLLAAGADVNSRQSNGYTALDFCRGNKTGPPETQKAVEALLLQHGAKTGKELDAEKSQPTPEPAKPEPGK